MKSVNDVLDYWFDKLGPEQWYTKSDDLDLEIKTLFEPTLTSIVAGEADHWRATAEGCLAEIIVLDQFSRNTYRGSPLAFAQDSMALALAQVAVQRGDDQLLKEQQRGFMYMPYMHSESLQVHEVAMQLFANTENLPFEIKHKDIIERFGRYPHRNEILGRESTAEELEWMKTNSGF